MGSSYSRSYFEDAAANKERERLLKERQDAEVARIANGRRELASKIVTATTDKIVNEIIRPGPKPEERECYEMAGETRALNPELEELVKQIIDVNDGVK